MVTNYKKKKTNKSKRKRVKINKIKKKSLKRKKYQGGADIGMGLLLLGTAISAQKSM